MGYRNIKIETSQQLSIKNRQLFIGSSGEVQIPLEDINSILIESQAVTLSSYFLQKMRKWGLQCMFVTKNICQMQCFYRWYAIAVILNC